MHIFNLFILGLLKALQKAHSKLYQSFQKSNYDALQRT